MVIKANLKHIHSFVQLLCYSISFSNPESSKHGESRGIGSIYFLFKYPFHFIYKDTNSDDATNLRVFFLKSDQEKNVILILL